MRKTVAFLIVLVLVTGFGGLSFADLNDGLVAFYPFNGNSFDESGNGNDGFIFGDVTLTEDRLGNADRAYSFDGEGDLIEVPDDPLFHFTDQMTITAWVKPLNILKLQTILNKWYALDSYGIFINAGNFIFVVAFPDGAWGQTIEVSAPATIDTWTHVAGVFDGNQILIYLNGGFVASEIAIGTLQDSDRPIAIGNHPSWNAFQGSIDEVRLYNRALSASEIQELASEKVSFDIKPGSCPNPLNIKSQGVIPVAIHGTEDIDVTKIDPESLLLEGVPPIRWSYEDVATPFMPFTGKSDCFVNCNEYGPDGVLDLTLKYDTQAVVQALGPVEDESCLLLNLIGNLTNEFDGIPIMGEDVVHILKKGNSLPTLKKSKK